MIFNKSFIFYGILTRVFWERLSWNSVYDRVDSSILLSPRVSPWEHSLLYLSYLFYIYLIKSETNPQMANGFNVMPTTYTNKPISLKKLERNWKECCLHMLESISLELWLKLADGTAPYSLPSHHPAGHLDQYRGEGICQYCTVKARQSGWRSTLVEVVVEEDIFWHDTLLHCQPQSIQHTD